MTFSQLKKHNDYKILHEIHPQARLTFNNWLDDCYKNRLYPFLNFTFRTFAESDAAYKRYKQGKGYKAAKGGRSPHNYGLASDIQMINQNGDRISTRSDSVMLNKIVVIAHKNNIFWLGAYDKKDEAQHFDIIRGVDRTKYIDKCEYRWNNNLTFVENQKWIIDLPPLGVLGNLEDSGSALIKKTSKKIKEIFSPNDINTTVKQSAYTPIINPVKYEEAKNEPQEVQTIKEVKNIPARGIWNIIKFVSDHYSLTQTINDTAINNSQGSLLSFIQKVVQKPWLQFFGTTLNGRYYFYCRKEPFDFEGWTKLPKTRVIKENVVLNENLKWFSGDVFSWYQLTPKGNFYTEQHLQFGYIQAVYFEEYADIWGSRPLSQISNYVNFYKTPNQDKDISFKKSIIDLKYMVESNCYLPFTREGSITIIGDVGIKPGYRIELESTQEIFYVDSVSHSYSVNDNSVKMLTTLQISRGMKKKYIKSSKKDGTISYFNLINFETKYQQIDGTNEDAKKAVLAWRVNKDVFNFFLNKRQNG
jgi:hypothetical protein